MKRILLLCDAGMSTSLMVKKMKEAAVKKAVKASGAEATDIKIYINAAEQAAYYTVDGAGDATNKVDLKTL